MLDSKIPHQDITYKVIGCAMKIHNRLPRGLREIHYQNALQNELLATGLVTTKEYHLEIYDGDVWLGRLYLDHWVSESVVVEDKAVTRTMNNDDVAQVLTYLAATQAKVGLFLNFGRDRLEYRRILPTLPMQRNWQQNPHLWKQDIQKYLWKPKNYQPMIKH